MVKLTIPVLLAATIAVAGMFAFMPVEQASTVHTTGTAQGSASVSTSNTDASDTSIILSCGSSAGCVFEEIYITDTDGANGVIAINNVVTTINSDAITVTTDTTVDVGQGTTNGLIASASNVNKVDLILGSGDKLTLTIATSSTAYTVTTISSGTITITFA